MIGGEDFDPSRCGEKPHPNLGKANNDRDGYDLTPIRYALRPGIPLPDICRGLQGMHIAAGGTLYQAIPATYLAPYIRHRSGGDRLRGCHTVRGGGRLPTTTRSKTRLLLTVLRHAPGTG